MEQHNIDSRFKEGLGNISRQPSADAWARLQSQMAAPEATPAAELEKEEEKRRPVFWLSIAAAVITLLVSVAVLRFAYQKDITSPELASNVVKEQQKVTAKTEVKPEIIQPEKEQIAMVSAPKSKATATEPNKAVKPEVRVEAKNRTLGTASETRQIAKVKTPEVKTVAAPETKVKPIDDPAEPEKLLAAQTPAAKVEKTTSSDIGLMNQTIEVIVKRDNASNQVAMNEEVNQEEIKRSLSFKNIVKQAVNLKKGEGVNLAELGIDHNSKLAMDTRNLRQKVSRVFEN